MKYHFSWLTTKAIRGKIRYGFGLFAKEKIKKGEQIIVFGGYVMDQNHFDSLSDKMKNYPIQITDNLYYGLSKISEIENADYLNHSCDANCGFDGEIIVVAIRDINKGEEITIDYAMTISSDKIEPMKCYCGSRVCRGIVKSNDWKIKELQKRYKNYFEPFLIKKIKNKK